MLTPEPSQPSNDNNPLASLLSDRSLCWDSVTGRSFANEQLCLKRLSSNALVLEWSSTTALRPDLTAPMLIQFIVPENEIAQHTPSAYKSQLIVDFLSSAAGESQEPLRSEFYQNLRQRGYHVRSISNATIAKELFRTFNANEAYILRCEIGWRHLLTNESK
jgi:hypothetical protein